MKTALETNPETTPAEDLPRPMTVVMTNGATFKLQRSTHNPDHSEVRFDAKPDETIRDALKTRGFRWSRRSACWYGLAVETRL